jgi:hypothetical protein
MSGGGYLSVKELERMREEARRSQVREECKAMLVRTAALLAHTAHAKSVTLCRRGFSRGGKKMAHRSDRHRLHRCGPPGGTAQSGARRAGNCR